MKLTRFGIMLVLMALAYAGPALADVELAERSFLGGRLLVAVPTEFGPMTRELLELKYPSSRRPTVVLSNELGSVNVALNHTKNRVTQAQVREAHATMEQSFRNLFPSAKWNRSEVTTLNGREVFVLDLVTPAIDTKIRNIMVGASLDDRFLIATFNCTIDDEAEWGPIGEKIMNSIRTSE